MCVCIYLYLCLYIWIYSYFSVSTGATFSDMESQEWGLHPDFGTPAPVPHRYKRQPYETGFLDLGIIDLFIDRSLLLCPPCKITRNYIWTTPLQSTDCVVCARLCFCNDSLCYQLEYFCQCTNTVFYIENKIYAQDMCILI